MSGGNILRIEQGGSRVKVWLNGQDISGALRGIDLNTSAVPFGRTEVRLDLVVDVIEISALGESDHTVVVRIPPEVESALQALGWVKTSDQNIYTQPRTEEIGI